MGISYTCWDIYKSHKYLHKLQGTTNTHVGRNIFGVVGEVDTVPAHLTHDVLPEYNYLLGAVQEAARVADEHGIRHHFLYILRHELE